MTARWIDPTHDAYWLDLLQSHARASVFHSAGWLDALRKTYEYEPIAYTTSRYDGQLQNGWVFCKVNSWLTGNRLVSLPFSDHCDPLVCDSDEWEELAQAVETERDEGYDRIECRPRDSSLGVPRGFKASRNFCFHHLNLQQSLEDIFRKFHKDSVQRRIRRAEREGLTCSEGRSEELLGSFYELMVSTRARHGLPPQPRTWFSNLVKCMGEQLNIRVASKNGTPVSAILTLHFKKTLVYKYGCSDARYSNLGGTQLLLWRAIEEAKKRGAEELDLGRSDTDDQGLIVFKDRWGAQRSMLTYYQYAMQASHALINARDWQSALTRIGPHVPRRVLSTAGSLFYRHFG